MDTGKEQSVTRGERGAGLRFPCILTHTADVAQEWAGQHGT